MPINVTKTYLPAFEEYSAILKRAWDKGWITNHGVLVQELELKLKEFTNAEEVLFCGNGTIVLQMILKAMGITKEVITTPFSYVATTNTILWEGCTPVFVDIDPDTYCIDADKIESLITEDTQAILATHVYGIPCDVEKLQAIASRHKLKLIYDGAHSFGCKYKDRSLLTYGDASTCSFHATKIFHTVEGGCIISNDKELYDRLILYRSFGHKGDDYFSIGINGKNSEFHAAMGLAMFPHIPHIIAERKRVFGMYDAHLPVSLKRPCSAIDQFEYNYAYYPVLFENESTLLTVIKNLNAEDIFPRRYFYPSLNLLPQVKSKSSCPVSEDTSSRIACLPLYPGLTEKEVSLISSVIKRSL